MSRETRPPFQFSSAAIYTGDWVGQKREGHGKIEFPDGASYDGEWKENRVII